MAEVEVIDRVERRRKWSEAEKASLLAEVDAAGGKVAVVARRHRISESLLYNWRAAVRAAALVKPTAEPMEFMPLGVFGRADDDGPTMLAAPVATERPKPTRPSVSFLDGANVNLYARPQAGGVNGSSLNGVRRHPPTRLISFRS